MVNPILVTGSHRSGTTWVGKMLAESPGMAYLQEPMNPGHRRGECRADFGAWFPVLDEQSGARFVRDLQDCLSFRYDLRAAWTGAQGIKTRLRIPMDQCRCWWYRSLGKRPVMKDPIALLSAEWLALEFQMDVIVMIRHPAAFVGSLKRTGWNFPFLDLVRQGVCLQEPLRKFQSDVERFAREPQDIVSQGVLLWNLFHTVIRDYQLRHPEWNYVRHEDLSLDPLYGFESLFQAVGLDFSEGVRRKIESSTKAVHSGHEALHSVQRDSRKNVDSWRRRLEPSEIEKIKSGTMELAEQLYGERAWNVSGV
jgi:hypothetical protein